MTDRELKRYYEECMSSLKNISTNTNILVLLMFVLVVIKGCE